MRPQSKQFLSRFPWEDFRTALSREAHNRLYEARLCILYLAVLTSVVAYLLWYYALSKTEASKVAIFSNLQPAATAVAAWLILGEALHWELLVGGVLIIAGVRLTQRARV